MREGSGLVRFSQDFPERYFDVGIAEQHAVTFAAGLACEGMKPVVAIYSTFLQRAYDQLIHDVQIQNLPVVFAIDRGGLVGADGATHNGSFDLSYLRCLPNMTVMTPSDENECRQMLYTAFQLDTPAAVRYPRGAGPGAAIAAGDARAADRQGRDPPQRQDARALSKRSRSWRSAAWSSRRSTPRRSSMPRSPTCASSSRSTKRWWRSLRESHDLLVTVEENVIAGGAGSAVLEALQRQRIKAAVLQLGLPDRFIDHGDPALQLKSCGLDKAGIVASVREKLAG